MTRRLFTVLAGASLVLCAATCVLWLWSYARGIATEFTVRQVRWQFAGSAGRLRIDDLPQQRLTHERALALSQRQYDDAVRLHDRTQKALLAAGTGPDADAAKAAYQAAVEGSFAATWRLAFAELGPSARITLLSLPLAVPAALTAVLPIAWFATRHRQRRRRTRPGRCPACGYDLRATPGRCPECGAVPPAAADA